ncbi:clostripain-related cysteine peptidase [uncultured Bacteroides sp.]|uniref:clostripain-related cysteine peptidase n=1 Tax=uncultured Bacteroides sp. TaxID=162156 RepID=UPI0025F79329|nr:clostripain-related cysteine peptidase [uncultured Bacteroides sp.]
MKTKQKRYRLIELVAFFLFLSFSMGSCEKVEWISTTPDTEETDPDDEEEEPADRSDNDQTVFMYLPWSTNLLPFFGDNINDMKTIIGKNILKNERVVVFLASSPTKATLFELTYKKGKCKEKALKEYNFETLEYTTAEGITSILNDVKQYAPAKRYAMTIGCHGYGWIPKSGMSSRSGFRANKMHWEYENVPMTRFFGGLSTAYQTDITTLATGISDAGLKMEYILFDDCYMSTVEVAYDLKEVADYLIACPTEIMARGMPYEIIGQYLIGDIDYNSICNEFYAFYSTYEEMPCGTIGVTDCSELDNLASMMKAINQQYTFDSSLTSSLQRLDGYSPVIFFDYGDYVSKLCKDSELLEQFNEQLERTVPFKRNTDYYYSRSSGRVKINTYSGITISDPSTNPDTSSKEETAWYKATH